MIFGGLNSLNKASAFISITHIPKNGKQNNDNVNNKLQCFTKKNLISPKFKKYSTAKYALLLYLAVFIRSLAKMFDP